MAPHTVLRCAAAGCSISPMLVFAIPLVTTCIYLAEWLTIVGTLFRSVSDERCIMLQVQTEGQGAGRAAAANFAAFRCLASML
jgi:hypothetical protein